MELATTVLFLFSLLLPLPPLALLFFLLRRAHRSFLSFLWLQSDTRFTWSQDYFSSSSTENHSICRPSSKFKSSYYKSLAVSSFGVVDLREDEKRDAECAVCLCEIEAGDEVRELRCNHLFHRTCLDRWVEHGRSTCPLCREPLAPVGTPEAAGDEPLYDEDVEEEEEEMYTSTGLLYMVCLHRGGW